MFARPDHDLTFFPLRLCVVRQFQMSVSMSKEVWRRVLAQVGLNEDGEAELARTDPLRLLDDLSVSRLPLIGAAATYNPAFREAAVANDRLWDLLIDEASCAPFEDEETWTRAIRLLAELGQADGRPRYPEAFFSSSRVLIAACSTNAALIGFATSLAMRCATAEAIERIVYANLDRNPNVAAHMPVVGQALIRAICLCDFDVRAEISQDTLLKTGNVYQVFDEAMRGGGNASVIEWLEKSEMAEDVALLVQAQLSHIELAITAEPSWRYPAHLACHLAKNAAQQFHHWYLSRAYMREAFDAGLPATYTRLLCLAAAQSSSNDPDTNQFRFPSHADAPQLISAVSLFALFVSQHGSIAQLVPLILGSGVLDALARLTVPLTRFDHDTAIAKLALSQAQPSREHINRTLICSYLDLVSASVDRMSDLEREELRAEVLDGARRACADMSKHVALAYEDAMKFVRDSWIKLCVRQGGSADSDSVDAVGASQDHSARFCVNCCRAGVNNYNGVNICLPVCPVDPPFTQIRAKTHGSRRSTSSHSSSAASSPQLSR